jgi:flagellar basal body-associated protein FliL
MAKESTKRRVNKVSKKPSTSSMSVNTLLYVVVGIVSIIVALLAVMMSNNKNKAASNTDPV